MAHRNPDLGALWRRARPSGRSLRGSLGMAAIGLALTLPIWATPDPQIRVYSVEKSYGPFELASDGLQQTPAGVVPVGFEDAVWVLGYSAAIDVPGSDLPERDFHCHTMMTNPSGAGHPGAGHPFKGVFTDGYTKTFRLPPGYGIPFAAGERMTLMPMFNNRTEEALDASIQVRVDFVLAEDLPEPLIPLYSTAVSIAEPYLYMVPPGVDVRERRFRLPYAGVVHAMAIHIHPYGRSVELINETRDETVWHAVGTAGADGRLVTAPFFSSEEGYRFGPEDQFLLRATYHNPTDVEQDAMAGIFVFFATDDGEPPGLEAEAAASGEGHGAGHETHPPGH